MTMPRHGCLLLILFFLPANLSGQVKDSVEEFAYQIQVEQDKGGPLGGSCVCIFSDGKQADFLTAAHVCNGGTKATIWRGQRKWIATVIKLDKDGDIALVRAENMTEKIPYAVLAKDAPQTGEEVWKVGFPVYAKGKLTTTYGTASGGVDYSLYVRPGDSGSGVFNRRGQLVDVITTYETNREAVAHGCGLAAIKNATN